MLTIFVLVFVKHELNMLITLVFAIEFVISVGIIIPVGIISDKSENKELVILIIVYRSLLILELYRFLKRTLQCEYEPILYDNDEQINV
jgi:hypothetical protein